MPQDNHEILLYYKYVNLPDAAELVPRHKEKCRELGLTGRIIIAQEGINGTVEGTKSATNLYQEYLQSDSRFAGIKFKVSAGTGKAFPKLSVKLRSEIVSLHLGAEDFSPTQTTGKYITAEELHAWIHGNKEFYIVDMRNDYEHAVGHFAQSILPPMTNFRDLQKVLPQLEHLKNKTVVTVCTGGVRCEKASGFLVKHGFKHVYQLLDGIVTYMEKYPNQDFLGQLYVFDGRITMGFNLDSPDHVVVGRCASCAAPCESYVNCAHPTCHKHLLACQACREANGEFFCSPECKHNNSNSKKESMD